MLAARSKVPIYQTYLIKCIMQRPNTGIEPEHSSMIPLRNLNTVAVLETCSKNFWFVFQKSRVFRMYLQHCESFLHFTNIFKTCFKKKIHLEYTFMNTFSIRSKCQRIVNVFLEIRFSLFFTICLECVLGTKYV